MQRNFGLTHDAYSQNFLPLISQKYTNNRITCNLNRINLSRGSGRAFMQLSTSARLTPSIHALSPSSLKPVFTKRTVNLVSSDSEKQDLKINARKLSLCVKFRG